MAGNHGKVLINLDRPGDAERVTVALLVATAAADAGKRVGIWLTKEAVRLALSGRAQGVACDGCPPLPKLLEQFAEGGGELLPCPICFAARKLDESDLLPNAHLTGATPMWEWVGDGVFVFSY